MTLPFICNKQKLIYNKKRKWTINKLLLILILISIELTVEAQGFRFKSEEKGGIFVRKGNSDEEKAYQASVEVIVSGESITIITNDKKTYYKLISHKQEELDETEHVFIGENEENEELRVYIEIVSYTFNGSLDFATLIMLSSSTSSAERDGYSLWSDEKSRSRLLYPEFIPEYPEYNLFSVCTIHKTSLNSFEFENLNSFEPDIYQSFVIENNTALEKWNFNNNYTNYSF